ncbi:MAG: NAD(P)H-hydrate dehydratase [Nocardioidaceae bacterium]
MRQAHTTEQIREAEAELMAGLPDGALMRRAAAGLAAVCAQMLPYVYGARVLVLAGPGNNGGDALFAAAGLARRGARCEVILVADTAHAKALADFVAAGGRVVDDLGEPDLVLDGMVGVGGRVGLNGRAAVVAERISDLAATVVAVDVPSGVGVDSAELDGQSVRADLTVTFGTNKVGLLADPASARAGTVELVDIGLAPYLGPPAAEALGQDDVRRLLPRPQRGSHKYSRGVLGVAAGSVQYTGAGLLVTSGAVATGLAGMVRYDGASAELVRARLPEAVIGRGRVQAWVVGSGIGNSQDELVGDILAEDLPTVVDADGLRHLPSQCSAPVVLTPHAGELADLLQVDRTEVEARTVWAAAEAARRRDCVVLLKGARSVIAAPDGRLRVNTTGVPWLATAGAGDVLSGVIGSLLAGGLNCFDAACVGAWLHGAAANLASGGGPITAVSVAEKLPAAVAGVLAD